MPRNPFAGKPNREMTYVKEASKARNVGLAAHYARRINASEKFHSHVARSQPETSRCAGQVSRRTCTDDEVLRGLAKEAYTWLHAEAFSLKGLALGS
eukprot:symbB.v1.2.016469.t1/scaffold1252.1/size200744/17